jgi:hypothetical protein
MCGPRTPRLDRAPPPVGVRGALMGCAVARRTARWLARLCGRGPRSAWAVGPGVGGTHGSGVMRVHVPCGWMVFPWASAHPMCRPRTRVLAAHPTWTAHPSMGCAVARWGARWLDGVRVGRGVGDVSGCAGGVGLDARPRSRASTASPVPRPRGRVLRESTVPRARPRTHVWTAHPIDGVRSDQSGCAVARPRARSGRGVDGVSGGDGRVGLDARPRPPWVDRVPVGDCAPHEWTAHPIGGVRGALMGCAVP